MSRARALQNRKSQEIGPKPRGRSTPSGDPTTGAFRRRPPASPASRPKMNVRIASVLRVRITAAAARRFLVARHFLAPARSLEGGLDAVLEVFRKLGSIQFDPLAVAGRNHDLVLHARVAGYDPAWCHL